MNPALSGEEKSFALSLKEKAAFTRQLSALIDAGLPVAKALHVIHGQTAKAPLKAELAQVLSELEEGIALSAAFRRWDSFLVSLLKAGETGGMLGEVLERLARFYEERFRLQSKVLTTLTYPLVIFLISLVIFIGMVTVILPQFTQIYARLGSDLPAFTRFWMELSAWLRSFWGLGLLGVLGVMLYGLLQAKDEVFSALEKHLAPVPVVGEVIVQFASTRFARTLGTLLRCGVPLTSALEISAVKLFPVDQIKAEVMEGVPLHRSLEGKALFPSMLTAMVAVGEETGELNKLLLKAADYYDQELEGILSRLTSLIEPAIIVILGGLIGSVVVGMYLPMFQVFNQVQ